jgi:hypothetical protein
MHEFLPRKNSKLRNDMDVIARRSRGRQDAGCYTSMKFLLRKNFEAQNRQGRRFWAAQGIEAE